MCLCLVLWLDLLKMLEINVPLRSVFKYQNDECAFTSPMSMEYCVSVMCSMKYIMSVSGVA